MNGQNSRCPLCDNPPPSTKDTFMRTLPEILNRLDMLRNQKQEFLLCFSLDGRQKVLAQRVVTIGLLDTVLTHPREVFAEPLTDRAASIIIAHNHPSGEAAPSLQDIKATQQLVAAGILLGIPLRDHVIITSKGHYSFRQHSLL